MIKLDNIHLKMGNKELLENETISIFEGYIHVITGESGCGKTTLLHEISLLSNYSKSIYHWNDERIDQLNDANKAKLRRTRIGYILQDLELISEDLSLRENIQCMFSLRGLDYDEVKVNEYMRKFNLTNSLDERIDSMSRGERQRFALVMALIKDVDLIFCDEPTSALDIENAKELMQYLRVIANEYKKMIVIATHDHFVAKHADFLYHIENKHLLLVKETAVTPYQSKQKEILKINNQFYKTYQRINKKLANLIMKIVYIIMIMTLCIAPAILDSLLKKQNELYRLYANNEIIVVNTKTTLPYGTYNNASEVFKNEQIDLLNEIEHVKKVSYYWEMEGTITKKDKTKDIIVVPKNDIKNIVLSSQLASNYDNGAVLDLFLMIEDTPYTFNLPIEKFDIKDYPPKENVTKPVIYMPSSMMNELVAKYHINTSSAVKVTCDKISNIESTAKEIQRWLSGATISSSGTKYLQQIETLKQIEQFVVILRILMIIGIVVVAYIIQTMSNKAREKEIGNLRINGMDKKAFYQLYYYENKMLIFLTVICCLVGYSIIMIALSIPLTIKAMIMILMQVIIFIIITRIIPLLVTIEQIFKKEISGILRDN